MIDDLALIDCVCDPCSGTRGRSGISATDGEFLTVLHARHGAENVEQGGERGQLGPGDALLWNSMQPCRFAMLDHYTARSLQVLRAAFDEVVPRGRSAGTVLLRRDAPTVRLLLGFLDGRTSTLQSLSPAARTAARNAALELLHGAIRPEPSVGGAAAPALHLNMSRWIERNLSYAEITPAAVGAAHGVSERTVRRVFETTGESFGQFVRARRLARAREDIAAGAEPISSIAYRWGFSDSSHLCRAFKAQYGTVPGEYRERARRRLSGVS